MEHEKKIFSLIVKNSVFAFIKEKYPHYNIDDKEEHEDIIKLTKLLLQLEHYAHIPDKEKVIKDNYCLIKSLMKEGSFMEAKFLEALKNGTSELTLENKIYILNSTIYITYEDKKISDIEKETILQIARFLGIKDSYAEILKNYEQSDFKKEISSTSIIILGVLILLAIGVGIFFKVQDLQNIKVFKTNKQYFEELHFNRYIIYKNKYSNNIQAFKKYAVYYIEGTARVSFNPKNIFYNVTTKTITLKHSNFKIDIVISPKNKTEIDRVDAKPITEDQAQGLGVVVGLAGAYGGATIGSKLTSLLPSSLQAFSSGVGGLLAGTTGYVITTKALKDARLTPKITETDRKNTLKIGKELIKIQLQTDELLQKMYKKDFEDFVKAKYKTFNMEVLTIVYKDTKNGDIK